MSINVLLTVVGIVFVLVLIAIEAYTAIKGVPTISARVQDLGRRAPLVVIGAAFLAGMLLTHFFACS